MICYLPLEPNKRKEKPTTLILFQKITFAKAAYTLGFSLNSSKLIKDYLFFVLILIIQVLDFL
jgi:hypothetical protein